GNCFSKPR
nr:Chain C, Apoptosis-inducing factor 3 [Homo sapiens]6SK3_D Chain D, Apoptosis-inducing factor 3 [Homo sapiens]6SKJ_C Chain C, Apoptosis-inducing factor 3 [Homo sapiens]6SKJ_D Chain D, Apoptosis-inducing factor 3 [Homo sapiens]